LILVWRVFRVGEGDHLDPSEEHARFGLANCAKTFKINGEPRAFSADILLVVESLLSCAGGSTPATTSTHFTCAKTSDGAALFPARCCYVRRLHEARHTRDDLPQPAPPEPGLSIDRIFKHPSDWKNLGGQRSGRGSKYRTPWPTNTRKTSRADL
jgi:hypothetical protein